MANNNLATLIELQQALENHAIEVMDADEYDPKAHDVTVKIGKRAYNLEFNADLYEGLALLVRDSIKQERELTR